MNEKDLLVSVGEDFSLVPNHSVGIGNWKSQTLTDGEVYSSELDPNDYYIFGLSNYNIINRTERVIENAVLDIDLLDKNGNKIKNATLYGWNKKLKRYQEASEPYFGIGRDTILINNIYPNDKVGSRDFKETGKKDVVNPNKLAFFISLPPHIFEKYCNEGFKVNFKIQVDNDILEFQAEPSVDIPSIKKDREEAISEFEGSNKKGCFIATAVYGTPNAKEIDILRDFRDQFLLNSKLGKIFTKNYYKYSPSLSDLISRNNNVRKFFGCALVYPLRIIVKKLFFKD